MRKFAAAFRTAGVFFAFGCVSRQLPEASELFDNSPYRGSAETALAAAQSSPLYAEVLRFYAPVSGQARLLDLKLLPDSRDSQREVLLESSAAHAIVNASGVSRICVGTQAPLEACGSDRGGVIRLSAPFLIDANTARVAVQFKGIGGRYAPDAAYSGTQVFLLRREGGRWIIAARAVAATP